MKVTAQYNAIIEERLSPSGNTELLPQVEAYETSASGNRFKRIVPINHDQSDVQLTVKLQERFQTITGFGGSFTKASAHVLNQMGKENRAKILKAYFGGEGAQYSLTRTHINSCDFSPGNYSYAPVANDLSLNHFTIDHEKTDLIPIIKEAMAISKEGFKIIASPWTAPPWMKDNNQWIGGKLLPEYYQTWALFFAKYVEALKLEGIPIWALTVENEPLGNGNNWESMHYTADEMTHFVKQYLGPTLKKGDLGDVKILGYDQNREHLREWVDVMYKDEPSSRYYSGTAIHWYASTYEIFPEALQYAHAKAPTKYLIQTEACVDAQIPRWKDDEWYWKAEATDWGWNWAPENQKYLHPKYAPVHRYAKDIIGCLNNWVDGWVDWNLVLDKRGGPNWVKNWCIAPIIADPATDQVYFTPLYHIMKHFSKFIRPGAVRIGVSVSDSVLWSTAAHNKDGTVVIVLFNESEKPINANIKIQHCQVTVPISANAIQTIVVGKTKEKSI